MWFVDGCVSGSRECVWMSGWIKFWTKLDFYFRIYRKVLSMKDATDGPGKKELYCAGFVSPSCPFQVCIQVQTLL